MDCSNTLTCKGRLQISKSYPLIEGDNSPDTKTTLFEIQELSCLNERCDQFGIVKQTARHERELT